MCSVRHIFTVLCCCGACLHSTILVWTQSTLIVLTWAVCLKLVSRLIYLPVALHSTMSLWNNFFNLCTIDSGTPLSSSLVCGLSFLRLYLLRLFVDGSRSVIESVCVWMLFACGLIASARVVCVFDSYETGDNVATKRFMEENRNWNGINLRMRMLFNIKDQRSRTLVSREI